MLLVLLVYLLTLTRLSTSYGPYPVQYIGNFLTQEQYDNLTLCDSQLCLDDAQRLLSDASHDNKDPCKSFTKFSCGTFFEKRAGNERYESVGFKRTYELKNDEKRHRVLKVRINENEDCKAVKIVKNFYQKCVSWSEFSMFVFCWNLMNWHRIK